MEKYKIGVMGSAQDLNYSMNELEFAKKIGELIAKSDNILVYGAEKDYSSLSTNAAIAADKNGGITLGITGGKKKEVYGDFRPTILIPCGQEIGGGREFVLVLSCDVIVAIGGGSGTLTEMAIAYQAGIPIVTVNCFRGWAMEMAGKYFDDRKRLECVSVNTPEEAVDKALTLVKKYKK